MPNVGLHPSRAAGRARTLPLSRPVALQAILLAAAFGSFAFAQELARDPSGRLIIDPGTAPPLGSGVPKAPNSFLPPSKIAELSTSSSDAYGFLSADGRGLTFASDRSGGAGLDDLWIASRLTSFSAFGAPVVMGSGVNGSRLDIQPSLTADGLEIFFARTDPGFDPWNATDLYRATRSSPSLPFDAAAPIAELNSALADAYPFITPDGLQLYFTSDRSGSAGNDIWVAARADRYAPFGPPVPLASVNTADDEISFTMRADGLAAYFCRAPLFGSDTEIYEMKRVSLVDAFSVPALVTTLSDPAFDTAPSVSADGRQLVFSSYNRPGGSGGLDLWRALSVNAALPAVVDLGLPPGNESTRVQRAFGKDLQDNLGGVSNAVAYGDFNGDGKHDIAMGAIGIGVQAGGAFILYGNSTVPPSAVNFKVPTGSLGETRISGDDNLDAAGAALAAGDFNGDGFDDLLLGAPGGDQAAGADAGEIYILYGSASIGGTSINLGQAPGANGEARILGAGGGDAAGSSLAVGDVNGDGFDDAIIGAPGALAGFGEGFIVYGAATLPSSIDLAAPLASNGVTQIPGIAAEGLGCAAACGDVDADGLADAVFGTQAGGASGEGRAYIVFGATGLGGRAVGVGQPFGADRVAQVRGESAGDLAGRALAAGDINADGFADIVISAPGDLFTLGATTGSVRVVFGSASLANSVAALSNSPGAGQAVIWGDDSGDRIATSVAAGDVNGDGFDDVIFGASAASSANGAAGEAYVIYGSKHLAGSVVNLGAGEEGSRILGDNADDKFGGSCAAGGDFNLDGMGDLAAAAPQGDNPQTGGTSSEEGYVAQVFGKGLTQEAVAVRAHVPGSAPAGAFGGRLSPALRAGVAYPSGDNGSGDASLTTATIVRSDQPISNLGGGSLDDVADVFWILQTDRVAFGSATLRFHYLDAEVASLLEATLKLYAAPSIDGPWTPVASQSLDAARNEFSATVSALGCFAIAGEIDPAFEPVYDATFHSSSLPTQMFAGSDSVIDVRFRNKGLLPISSPACKLGVRSQDSLLFPAQASLVPLYTYFPNEIYPFYIQVAAPPVPGVYHARLQMIKNDTQWFGEAVDLTVTVLPRPNAAETWVAYD